MKDEKTWGSPSSSQDSKNLSPANETAKYGRRVGLLTIGIGVTGLVTFAYFFLAAHTLSRDEYGTVALLWSAVFIVVSILYRPVEQLLARTVAEYQAGKRPLREPLRAAVWIQITLGAVFAIAALSARSTIEDRLLSGNSTLFWILLLAVLAYAASYFGRGLLAGSKRVGLYGLLVFVEATSRFLFAAIAALGCSRLDPQTMIAFGILAAPLLSLFVVPLALKRRAPLIESDSLGEKELEEIVASEAVFDAASSASAREESDFSLLGSSQFALAALLIMVAEQTFLNAGPLVLKATGAGTAVAGYAFNLLLIARAPVQLFQSVSTSLLPHLTTMRADGDSASYRRSVSVTILAIAGFAGGVSTAMLAAGPWMTRLAFSDKYVYDRIDLALVGLGMGFYLAAATLNQSALAARKAALAAACWMISAAAFVGWLVVPLVEDDVFRIETGFLGSAVLLCASLGMIHLHIVRHFDE